MRFVFDGRAWFALTAACLLAGCAHPIKVKERWRLGPSQAVDLTEASATWQMLRRGDLVSQEDLVAYNEAVRDSVVQVARNWSGDKVVTPVLETTAGPVSLSVDARAIREVSEIDHLVPADFVAIKRGLEETTIVDGLGASLVVRRRWNQLDPLVPKTGLWLPMTGLLDLDDPGRPVLLLLDSMNEPDFRSGPFTYPLAANYSAFLAKDLEERQRQFLRVPALFHYGDFEERMGIYRMSGFDPAKEVCVLVHGINSRPSTWNVTLNRLLAEEEIRDRYEFWLYGYPTGAPIPYLAVKFRESLQRMTEFRRVHGATDLDMTLVGHSMGGLLAKAATQRSGQENWSRVFTVPPSELNISPEHRELLERMMFFEPNPHVERVVFVATPHRGSRVAQKSVVRLAADLVEVPGQLIALSSTIVEESDRVLTPFGQRIAEEIPTSIHHLGFNSELTRTFSNIPLNDSVEYYSVIGRKKGSGKSLKTSTDGVVSYESAHIEGVVAEIVLDSPHGVHKTEKGAAAIARILKEAE